MMFKTHLAFGLLIALFSLKFFKPANTVIFVLIAIFFSILPDIDKRNSKIGKRFKFLSYPIELLLGHRGLFHTIYIPILAFLLFFLFNNAVYGIGAFVGYFSHLDLDSLTISGIKPFYPLINKKIKGFIKTNSNLEFVLFLIISMLDLYVILKYIF